MKLYSNYHLYKLPYYYLETIKQIDFCRDGVVLLDEFWKICDARLSRKASNRVVADILARSRKRQLIYIFTAQVLDSVDKRIKKVTDFSSYPLEIGQLGNTTKVLIFRTAVFKNSNFMKQFYFDRWIPQSCYNSFEEIDTIDDTSDENPAQPPKLMWQEGTSRCAKCKFVMTQTDHQCPQCEGTEFIPIEPMYFNDWETADRFATEYWEKLLNKEGITDTEDGVI